MRTPLRSLAVAAALTLALGACGDDAPDEASAAPAEAVAIEHKFGTTDIPEPPERVVTVGYTEADTVLALGVTPVGVREFLGGYEWRERPWARDALAGARPEVVGAEEINFEAVAAQRPDLIVGINSGMTEGDYRRLSRIAPTLAQTDEHVDFGVPWQEQTEVIGQALGREDEALDLIEQVEARFAQARDEHPAFEGATAILAYGGPDGYGAYSTQDTRSRFLTDLGFDTPERIDEIAGDAFFTALSQERLRLVDEDAIVMFGPQDEIEDNPVFGRLDAVAQDRVIYLDLTDQFAGALGYASVLSLPFLLDEAVPKLAAAVDGDPATGVQQPQ